MEFVNIYKSKQTGRIDAKCQVLLPLLNLSERGVISPELNEVEILAAQLRSHALYLTQVVEIHIIFLLLPV